MKKEDAKREIQHIYNSVYLPSVADDGFLNNAATPLLFYSWLRENHPNSLNFRSSADKYQVIKTWIGFS